MTLTDKLKYDENESPYVSQEQKVTKRNACTVLSNYLKFTPSVNNYYMTFLFGCLCFGYALSPPSSVHVQDGRGSEYDEYHKTKEI